MATSKLCVKVVHAHELIPKDQQSTASAFVVLSSGSQQFRTSTKFKDVSPSWNESFYFDMPDPSNHAYLVLDAYVYGVDKSVQSSRSLLGEVRQSVDSSRSDAHVMYLPLEKGGVFSRETGAWLGLKLNVIDNSSIRAQEAKIRSLRSTEMRLCVEVVSAHDLMPKDEQGSASTCVELSFDYFQHRTSVKEKDLNPVWNELLYFDVWDISSIPTLVLEARVYNVDKSIKGSKSFLGVVRLNSSSFLSSSDGAATTYYPLQRSGLFSHGVKGGLRMRVYITSEPSIRAPELNVSDNPESILQNQGSKPYNIPFEHLKEITNNFSMERIIGQGGFGVIYKGVLRNGETIAVKKIKSSLIPGTQKTFENEVYHLMMVEHPNIVRFVGYCYETRNMCLVYDGKHVFAETTERLLCLEYLPNGSLDKYISDESSGLDWSTRYKIIEGICNGLCHLHKQNVPIIHMDLKPANILLDDGMVAKITDFGLSRLLDQTHTICTTSRDGTFGYMAPEFLHGGTITSNSDIFSLGVIIMEVVTGHRDYPDVTRPSSDDFIKLVSDKWKNVLQISAGNKSIETDCQQIEICIQVGLICVNPDRTKRPPIAQIINMLHGPESINCDTSIEAA